MYRVDRNNFYKDEKKATIYTPEYASTFLYKILHEHITKDGCILDPCVGKGSLLKPWNENGYNTIVIDIEDQGFKDTIVKNYLEIHKDEIKNKISLVIMNPPFNIDCKTKKYVKEHYKRRVLLPEVWLKKTIELFNKDIPIVMFTPYGFRLNLTEKSERWVNFIKEVYPAISSIVSLPKNLFDGILFHSEVLIFNVKGLLGHYFVSR